MPIINYIKGYDGSKVFSGIMIICCLIAIICMAMWVFGGGTTLKPIYYLEGSDGANTGFNTSTPILARNAGLLSDGKALPSGQTAESQVKIMTTDNDPSKPGCKNSSTGPCLTQGSVSSDICNTTNCDTLWNVMIKSSDGSNSDGTVGMTQVNKILDNKNYPQTLPGLKNQIRHLLCQLGQQNVYKYNSFPLNVSSSLLTWDGIRTLNGWGDPGSGYLVFYGISMAVVVILYWKIMLLKVFKQAQNSSPSIFKLLIVGSTGGVSDKIDGWKKKGVYFFLIPCTSGVLYWFITQFFTTIAAGASIVNDAKKEEEESGEIPIIATTPRGYKALPIIVAVIFTICIMIFRYFCIGENKEDNLKFTFFLVLFQGLVIGLYVYFLIYLAKNSVDSQVSVSYSSKKETGLQWNTENNNATTFTDNGDIDTDDRSNPVYATVRAFLTCIITLLFLFLGTFWLDGSNTGNGNGNGNGCDINNTLKQLNSYNGDFTKIIPMTLCSMILMIVYFVLSGANLFVGICYPQVYIVLLIFQRLLITNFVYFDESDWHRNWDFLFFPLLSKTVNTLLVKKSCRESQEYISELYGTTNYKVFGRANVGPNVPGTRGLVRASWFGYPPSKESRSKKNINNLNTIIKQIRLPNNVEKMKKLFRERVSDVNNQYGVKNEYGLLNTIEKLNKKITTKESNIHGGGGTESSYTDRTLRDIRSILNILVKAHTTQTNKTSKDLEKMQNIAKRLLPKIKKNKNLYTAIKNIVNITDWWVSAPHTSTNK